MTNDEHARLTDAELAKAQRLCLGERRPEGGWRFSDDDLRGIVGTAIADTVLVVEDRVPISAFEQP